MFPRHLVPRPPVDIQVKFYGDRPRGTPSSGELNTKGVAEYSDFGPIERYISERCKIGVKFVLITNRKSHIIFRLVPNSVTLNRRRHNGHRRYLTYYTHTKRHFGCTAEESVRHIGSAAEVSVHHSVESSAVFNKQRAEIFKFKFKFIKTTKGSKSLLQVAKTYSKHKTNKHYMHTLCSQNKQKEKDTKTTRTLHKIYRAET